MTTTCPHCDGTGRTPIGGYSVRCGWCWGSGEDPGEREVVFL